MRGVLLAFAFALLPIGAARAQCPWGPTQYVVFPDQPAAQAMADALGMPRTRDGTIPTGDANFALKAPMQAPWITPPVMGTDGDGRPIIVTPGVAQPGYWAMLRFNTCWAGYDAAIAAIAAAGVLQTLTDPPEVFY